VGGGRVYRIEKQHTCTNMPARYYLECCNEVPRPTKRGPVDITKRIIGSSAVFSSTGDVTNVDIEGLVRRLLLFDKYVLVSVRLTEFTHLLNYLGFEGLRDLLFAKIIEIRCECLQIGQVGQSGIFGDPILPLLSYKFNWIDAHDRAKYIEDCLKALDEVPGLKNRQMRILKDAIRDSIRPLPQEARMQFWPGFVEELYGPGIVRASTEIALAKELGRSDIPFSLILHQEEGDGRFKVETDLSARAGISEADAHRIVLMGLMGVAGFSQAIGEMKAYSALSGFRDDELPLFRKKLDFLADVASSERYERSFQRVIEVAGVPKFVLDEERVNVEKLMKVRDSSEAREFRDWIASCGDANEDEIREQVAGWKTRVGLKAEGKIGKTLRFLVTNLAGLLPPPAGTIAGPALGVLDSYLFGTIIPRSGVAAFVDEMFPSIFTNR